MKKVLPFVLLLILFFVGLFFSVYDFFPAPTKERVIQVYIVGEINHEGVYELEEDKRLGDLIDVAGGLSEFADNERVNLAKRLLDGEMIKIPKKVEPQKVLNEVVNEESSEIHNWKKDQWMQIPGIGENTANQILEYLLTHPSAEVDDLKDVSGIGDKKLKDIREYIELQKD